MKKLLIVTGSTIFVLVAVLLFRANSVFDNNQYQVKSPLSPIQIDKQGVIQRFSQAIQIPTISYDDKSKLDHKAFADFHQFLTVSFPLVHQHVEKVVIEEYSLIYHLKGSNPDLKPALFMGHMDVVPAEQATLNEWQHPPFSGAISNEIIWGRGTIDDKVSVVALMESMEKLLEKGIQPKRSIYFSFGHDEEVGGKGAIAAAEYFAKQNIRFEFVLDEGGIVSDGLVPGTSQPIALVGIAEKGYVNFKLTVKGAGGHSSQPPAQTAAGILAAALVKVESHPLPATTEFVELMFKSIGFSTPIGSRLPMANLWLLSPVVKNVMLSQPSTAATLRTTTAITMLQGSTKSNVLPTIASAIVNMRILPGDTTQSIRAHLESVVDDPRVEVVAELANEASAVSSTDSLGFKLIESTIRRLDNSILVAPYLVLGATDSRHFYGLSDNIYRFMMVRLTPESLTQFHGINEQISIEDYLNAIQFYYAMLEQAAMGEVPSY